ncbi:MAG TPA: sigma-54-dependent Fis family transcriptional regulator [Clostridiales bacterium]|jgi:PAS domain S-box-containing protein|nr:sigma-54-dependent Fis family transcriptional regulator [Clostridiales bacterium]
MKQEFNFSDLDSEIFEFILDNIPDAITIVDASCNTIFWNKTSENYFGVKKEEIIGKDIREFFPSSLLPKVISTEESYHNIYNSPRKDSFTVISAVPIYNQENQLIGGLARDRDITEYVKLSELLSKTQTNLDKLEKQYSNYGIRESSFSNIITNNPEFIKTINVCKNISKTKINILLRGESGTGKELFAKAIHNESEVEGKFVAVNCSAIPKELFESELFGYDKGAFTGARKEGKPGKFEEANNGTIFLDEIGDMPLNMQPKILRILEEGYVTRIGSNTPIKLNIRIISATNKDIKELVGRGEFRKDLYYRLNTFQVDIKPLRERKEDIVLLANRFMQQFCMENGINVFIIPEKVNKILKNYKWEGNVRELKNVIHRAVILARENNNDEITVDNLPNYMQFTDYENTEEFDVSVNNTKGLEKTLEEVEKKLIYEAMKKTNWKKSEAANILGIPRTTLYYKLDKYGINRQY